MHSYLLLSAVDCRCASACVHGRYDTRLTAEGEAQATLARVDAKALTPHPEVLIASPLSRALHTAELAFGDASCPTIVEPLCGERIWLSSDVGRQPAELQQDFPTVDLDNLKEVWWHNNGSGDLQHVMAETPGNATSTCMTTTVCDCNCRQIRWELCCLSGQHSWGFAHTRFPDRPFAKHLKRKAWNSDLLLYAACTSQL